MAWRAADSSPFVPVKWFDARNPRPYFLHIPRDDGKALLDEILRPCVAEHGPPERLVRGELGVIDGGFRVIISPALAHDLARHGVGGDAAVLVQERIDSDPVHLAEWLAGSDAKKPALGGPGV